MPLKSLLNFLTPEQKFRINLVRRNFKAKLIRKLRNLPETQIHTSFQELSQPDAQFFFGYYDITPFSPDSKKVLAGKVSLLNEVPAVGREMEVGYFDLSGQEPRFESLGSTLTWCWQQSCRLQWNPTQAGTQAIYNTEHKGRYISKLVDISSKKELANFSSPIYSLSPDFKTALSLNFSRLQRLRPGYGYRVLPDQTQKDLAPRDDGLWSYNLQSQESELLYSLYDLSQIEPDESMADAEHYVNHLDFSPSGNRLLFFHLWKNKTKRFSRIFTCDLDGGNLHLLVRGGHASHHCWKSDKEVLVYVKYQDTGKGFYLHQDQTDERKRVGKEHLNGDGHPTYLNDKNKILVDSYPNDVLQRRLFIFDEAQNTLRTLGSFNSPASLVGELRCDLHPRLDPQNNYVCVDNIVNNRRVMSILDIKSS